MIEDGGFGGTRRRPVVMTRDRVEKLCQHSGIEILRALLDHPQAEVDVAEQAALVGLPEGRAAGELSNAAEVVEKRRGEEQIGAQARMELRRLPAQRRDSDRVLEEASRVAVMAISSRCRETAQRAANVSVAHERVHERREPGVQDLRGEEVEEPVELVGVPSERRCQLGGVCILGGLNRAHLHLQLAAEALDSSEHVHRVALIESPVEQVDVVPNPGLDAAACVGQLEREIRSARTGSAPLLLRHRKDALDRPILGELGDRGHVPSLWPRHVGTLEPMADVQPFRAVRYSGAAGSLTDLVAPPYDAVGPEERAQLFARSPFNVVHVTLPESADEAGGLYRSWLSDGILVRDDEPAAWLVVENYVGPDGVARERRGVAASIAAEPYETGHVLPHERTDPHVRDDRLRLLSATRVQPEPIVLLTDAALDLDRPNRAPDLEVAGTRLWRLPSLDRAAWAESELLIADGHHRYESTVELGAARIMALVVSVDDPGLRVFPTHRVFSQRPDLLDAREGESCASLHEAFAQVESESASRSAATAYRRGSIELVRGRDGELDVELVDRHGLNGIRYTQRIEDAVALVDAGAADVAFLVRPPRIADVFAVARRGERMPPKSTYFYPKPLSGLLFHPVQP